MARSIPIIRLEGNLIVSIQIELSDRSVLELRDSIADEICRREIKGLIIEVSGVDILDSFIARSIRNIAQLARLMGVRTVVAGLDPGMAVTLVEMGMVMSGVSSALNLEMALEALRREHAAERIDMAVLLGEREAVETTREGGEPPR